MKDRNLKHSDDWATPAYIYDPLNVEFGFDFDPCPLNATFDGLSIDWGGGEIFLSILLIQIRSLMVI